MTVIIHCPYCAMSFNVNEAELNRADGTVRCGACLQTFVAPKYIVEQPADERVEVKDIEPIDSRDIVDEPVLMTQSSGLWPAVAGLLGVLFLVQIAWFYQNNMVMDPIYRPYYIAVCHWLNCTLPDYPDLTALTISHLTVRPHPKLTYALLVEARLYNAAPYQQRFPQIQLLLADSDQKIIASRWFFPKEYLGYIRAGLRFIPAETEVRLSLEIQDPGQVVLNYAMQVQPN